MLFLCIATRSRECIDYSILCFRWFLGLLVSIHSTRLDSLLFFLEIVLDVGFRLLELLLGVAEFPGKGETDLAQRHLHRHILNIVRTHGLLLDIELVVGWCEKHQTQVQLILDDGFGEGGVEESHSALIALQVVLLALNDASYRPLQLPRQCLLQIDHRTAVPAMILPSQYFASQIIVAQTLVQHQSRLLEHQPVGKDIQTGVAGFRNIAVGGVEQVVCIDE